MSDNVIILGAGASHDAGIPLMAELMDTMWKMARTGKWGGAKLNPDDLKTLTEALKVRDELDEYHGRAAIDVWNIEDVLSILSFNVLAGGKKEKNRLNWMTKAIATVLELTCRVTHEQKLNSMQKEKSGPIYQEFWRALINWSIEKERNVPPILTFNYDLVLERSLLHALTGTYYRGSHGFSFDAVTVNYGIERIPPISFGAKLAHWGGNFHGQGEPGNLLYPLEGKTSPDKALEFHLLKLHGSVNFPKSKSEDGRSNLETLVTSVPDPLILPPVFNKATDGAGSDVWGRAMGFLRNCKHLIVCGYSLPATDIYMQYFLKSALGPNQELDRIFVFDPELFKKEEKGEALKDRYACNFSESIRKRINFTPDLPGSNSHVAGKMIHLVRVLKQEPEKILFG